MYDCEKHGYYGCDPCIGCTREYELEIARTKRPPMVVQHVHAPGPCPECAHRANRAAAQRWLFGLAVFLALAMATLCSAFPDVVVEKWRPLVFAPALAAAAGGLFFGIPRAHTEGPSKG